VLRAALLLSLTLIAAAAGAAPALGCARTVAGLDLQTATVPQLQAAMARGDLSSEELVRASLARIAAYDGAGPKLNAVRVVHPQALEQARALDAELRDGKVRGPLHGIPVLLKDNVDTADLPTTAGSISLEGAVPKRDATITARLRAAGAVILGKANLSEFAGWVDLDAPPGWSSLAGQVLNAYTFGDPSGSSAGSGVAASMAYGLTIGTETSGSILSPTSVSGIVGVKTTLGLVSRAGILPLAPSFDVPGPMVRSVTDAARVLDAIAGPDPADAVTAGAQLPPGGFGAGLKPDALKGARLAYSNAARDGLGSEAQALFDAAIAKAEALGATVRGVDALEAQNAGAAEIGLVPNEFKASLNRYLAEEQPNAKVRTLSDVVAFAGAHADRYPDGYDLLTASDATPGQEALYPSADAVRAGARGVIDGALAEGDAEAILAPGNTHANIGAAAGYPTVMVPLGYTADGQQPIGLGFMGQAFAEPRLLALAYAYEQATKTRVAPEAINPELTPASCSFVPRAGGPDGGPAPAGRPRALTPLRTTVRVRRRVLSVSVRGAVAKRLRVVVRRGKRVVARRTLRRGRVLRLRVVKRGVYAVTVLDPGPPLRTARARRARVR
jgi:amidase